MPKLNRLDRVYAEYRDEIDTAEREFGEHEGVSVGSISAWVAQFPDSDLPLAIKILSKIDYYSSSKIRAMAKQLVSAVRVEFNAIQSQRIYFVPVGNVYEGSAVIARALRNEVEESNIVHMTDIEKLGKEKKVGSLILVDDFSGTGDSLKDWWEDNVETIVRPLGIPYALALLVLNEQARPKIKSFARILLNVDELDDEHNVLSQNSNRFTAAEKLGLLRFCRRTGCMPEYLRGFDDCGLLLAFKHGCPDNSLPILWCDLEWRPLFKRQGL